MGRGISFSGTSGNATASGGTVALHITGLPNNFIVTKLKIVPSAGSGASKMEIFKRDTLSSTDRVYIDNAVSGNLYEPMDDSSGSPAEMPDSDVVIVYEDLDATGELHFKFTNNDSVDKTYAVTGVLEESWIFDSSHVATAQKAELLGDILYFGGRTSSHALLKRLGTGLLARLGDDSANAPFSADYFTASGSIIFMGAASSSDVSLRRSGNALLIRKGDDSGDGQLITGNIRSSTGVYQFIASNNSNPLLKSSGTNLLVRLGDDSGYAPLYSDYLLAVGGILALGGLTSSEVRLQRSGTSVNALLGDGSGYADFGAANIHANGNKYFFGDTTSSYPMLKRSSALLQIRLGDDSNYAAAEAAYFAAFNDLAIFFGAADSSHPALKRSSLKVQIRKGDDSGYGDIDARDYYTQGTPGATGSFTAGANTVTVTSGLVTAIV